ncbi:MAG: hypothetical protein H7Y00_10950, partial [Fimbriimonadaceae bacterium]|nr:hypothetical protein [Chitinophagales bacterium]
MKKILLLAVSFITYITAFSQGTIIGNTTYDVQTNNGSKNRIIVYDDGTISTVWTGSTDPTTVSPTFSDRGTFYNRFDGTSWGAYPTERIEDVRTGFVEILKVDDHEVSMGHYAVTASEFNIRLFANEEPGGTTWTETGGSAEVTGLWAFTHCPEGTDDIYIVAANLNPPTQFNFSRSDDGGETWSVLNSELPFLTTADGIPSVAGAAESYQIRTHGSDVYVLFGMTNSDLVLLHSNDYG